MKILIADDNRDAAESLAMILALSDHETVVATSGEEALRLAREATPQAMILDIGMPGMPGDQVAREVRREPWGARVLLLAVTGWGRPEDKARTKAAGFDHHLTKPIDVDEIERLLSGVSGAQAAPSAL